MKSDVIAHFIIASSALSLGVSGRRNWMNNYFCYLSTSFIWSDKFSHPVHFLCVIRKCAHGKLASEVETIVFHLEDVKGVWMILDCKNAARNNSRSDSFDD